MCAPTVCNPAASRCQYRWQHRDPAERAIEQVEPVGVAARREVAGTTGVAPVGPQLGEVPAAGQPPAEPVVRQAHRGGPYGVCRLVLGEPAQFGDGEGGDRYHVDRLGPFGRAQLGDEVGRGPGRPGVVPEQGRPDHLARLVQAHHPVLLRADRKGRHIAEPTGPGQRRVQCPPPLPRIHLGTVRVGRATGAHERPGRRVPDDDLARLGRRVHPGDQRRTGRRSGVGHRAPSRCSIANCVRWTAPSPRWAAASTSKSSNAERSASRSS